MGLIGKFISNAWNGIKEKTGNAGKMIKEGINATWNKGKEMVGAAGKWIADNQDTIGKIAGTAIGAGLNLYTGGAAAPWIAGANNFIQNLPDNILTRQLKNIAKGAVFDYGPNNVQKHPEKEASQTNAHTEYQSPPVMSNFVSPSSAVSSSNIIRRTVRKKPQQIRKTINGQTRKGKKAKGKKTKGKKSK